ncbi:Parathyroid hormone/parathyroid like protein [Argiope bruennichi]|uniref:Parathyroid hormone/parathyroid like protein n=1 Tax=Argiope bruennichi TaxID=94029 RepID=A0A8T0EDP3_ARGBR|nr:Parathyroid hormone/parathyroid like protein [Argiope bruennichi]
MDSSEKECLEQYKNVSLIDPFCAAAWDSFICWPPLSPGEMMNKPCPQMDTKGTVIGDATHPGMFAVRSCAENGSWVENRTNFSLCITNMAAKFRHNIENYRGNSTVWQLPKKLDQIETFRIEVILSTITLKRSLILYEN